MDNQQKNNRKSSRRRGNRKKFDNKPPSKQSPNKKDEVKKQMSPIAAERLQELRNVFANIGCENTYGVVVIVRWDGFHALPIKSQDPLYNSKYECLLDYGFYLPNVDKHGLQMILTQMQSFSKMNQVELKEKEYERALFWLRAFAQRPVGVILLDLQKIMRLEKVKELNPLAQFYCNVCNYCCNTMEVVVHHISDERHQKKLEVAREKISMKYLGSVNIPEEHCSSYVQTLEAHIKRVMMSEKNLKMRSRVKDDVNRIVQKLYPNAELVRLSMEIQKAEQVSKQLLKHALVANTLNSFATDTKKITHKEEPNLPLYLKRYEVRLIGSSVHGMGLETAEVNLDLSLPTDSKIPQVFLNLSVRLKEGDFSNVSIDYDADFLLLTFSTNSSKLKCTMSVNHTKAYKLALLLTEYKKIDPMVAKLAVLFRHWGQLTRTDDAKHGTLPGYAFYLLVIFFMQQKGLLPVLHEKVDPTNPESKSAPRFEKAGDVWKKSKEMENPSYLFKLWRELFKFYLVDFEASKNVVAINSFKPVLKETYKWGGKKLSILDPFTLRNIARSVYHEALHSYIQSCMVSTLVYHSIPVTKQGPIFGHIQEDFDACNFDCFFSQIDKYKKMQRSLVDQILKCDLNYLNSKDQENEATDAPQELIEPPECLLEWQDYLLEAAIPLFKALPPRNAYVKLKVTKAQAETLINALKREALCFSFSKEIFVNSKELPVFCAGCQQEGHYRDKCPDEFLPPMGRVPPVKPDTVDKLIKVCRAVQKKVQLSNSDLFLREKVLKELEGYINEKFPEAKLHLFGSSANGLGLKNSDLDICLILNNDEVLKNMTVAEFFNQLCAVLKASKSVYNVVPISTAKIPILKFVHRNSRLKGDISSSNLLALENTKLLKTYCSIDDRVSIMCQMMKYLMKSCNVCDASRGSLSSYAYSLMVVYFLQQCSPPVIPVLQELPRGKDRFSIDGFEVSYFNDIPNIQRVWPKLGSNTQLSGELWLDLLEFYTEKFDFSHNVIAPRQSKVLTKLEKLWFTSIAIEDPFEQTHNLGSALSKKMSVYILSIFQKARLLFTMPPSVPANVSSDNLVDHYFKHKSLSGGPPIGDRCCRHCGVIKHLMKDCPELKGKKDSDVNGVLNESTGLDIDIDDGSDSSELNDSPNGSNHTPNQLHPSPMTPHQQPDQGNISTHVEEFIKKLALNMSNAQSPPQPIPQRLGESPMPFFSPGKTPEQVSATMAFKPLPLGQEKVQSVGFIRSPQVSRNLFPEHTHIQYTQSHGSPYGSIGMVSPQQRPLVPPAFPRTATVMNPLPNHPYDPNFRVAAKNEPNGLPMPQYEEVKAWNRAVRVEPTPNTSVNDLQSWFQSAQLNPQLNPKVNE